MKKFILGIVVGILITVAGIFLFKEKANAPTPPSEETTESEVKVREIEPKESTIWNEFDGEIGI